MKIERLQDGLFRLRAETSDENEVVAAISDLVFAADVDEDVANDHGCTFEDGRAESALNYVTIPAADLSWIPAEDRG